MIIYFFIVSQFCPERLYSKTDSLLIQGIYFIYEENYQEARNRFNEAITFEPQNPAPYFMVSNLLALYMSDFSTDTLVKELFSYCDTTIMLSNKEIKTADTSGMPHLWLGGTYGLCAFYKAVNKNILSAAQDAMKGVDELTKAIKMDSCLFDAYIGISGYNYFKYRVASLLPWGGRSSWEKDVKLACIKSKYFGYASVAAYASFLIEEKRYKESIEIITPLIDSFPCSKVFRWTRVKAYCKIGELKETKAEYEKLLELTLASQPNTFYNIGYCRIELAKTFLKLGQKEECKNQCNEVLKLPYVKGMKKLKSEANKLLNLVKYK